MKYLYLSFLVLISFLTLFGQEDTMKVQLSDIIVSATKTPTEKINVASSFTVIDRQQIERFNLPTALQLLEHIEGVYIAQQGGMGTLNSLFIRGADANFSLVLIDGVEVNNPSTPRNAFDLSHLQTDNIERIEIVKGPQSTLYGSDALAGVINIFTRQGTETNRLRLQTEGGSKSYYKGSGYLTGSFNIFNYSINFSRTGTEGFSTAPEKYGNTEKDGYTNNSFSSQVAANLLKNLKFNLTYRYIDGKTDLDQDGRTGDDPNYVYNVEENIFRSSVQLDLFDGKWEQKLGSSVLRRYSNTIDKADEFRPNTASTNFANATRIKFDWQHNIHFMDLNTITLGFETEEEKANTEYKSDSEFGPYESIFPSQSFRTNSVYIQDQFILNNGFSATAGFRYDKNEKYGGESTYRLGVAHFIKQTGTKIKATYGTGFKAPSLYSLFDPVYGNPDLLPEENKGWDAGFEQYFFTEGLSFGATYFSMDFENMFGYDENFVTINIAKAETKGIESFIAFQKDNFHSRLTYTYTDALDKSEGENYNTKLIRRPQDKISLSLSYDFTEKLNVNTNIRFAGERDDTDFSTFPSSRVTLPDYTLVSLAASYRLFGNLKLFGRIENLFDEDYEEVLYYSTLGRSFYAGLIFDFDLE